MTTFISVVQKEKSNTAEETVFPLGLHSGMRSGCSFSSACHECKTDIVLAKFHHEVNALFDSPGELKWIRSDLPGTMVSLRRTLSL